LLETFLHQVSLRGGLYFAAKDIVVRIVFAIHGFAAAYVVARYDRAGAAATALFLGGPPCPRSVPRKVHVGISGNVNVFITSGKQNRAGEGGGEQGCSGLYKPGT
jgi:hypothetical protein